MLEARRALVVWNGQGCCGDVCRTRRSEGARGARTGDGFFHPILFCWS